MDRTAEMHHAASEADHGIGAHADRVVAAVQVVRRRLPGRRDAACRMRSDRVKPGRLRGGGGSRRMPRANPSIAADWGARGAANGLRRQGKARSRGRVHPMAELPASASSRMRRSRVRCGIRADSPQYGQDPACAAKGRSQAEQIRLEEGLGSRRWAGMEEWRLSFVASTIAGARRMRRSGRGARVCATASGKTIWADLPAGIAQCSPG